MQYMSIVAAAQPDASPMGLKGDTHLTTILTDWSDGSSKQRK